MIVYPHSVSFNRAINYGDALYETLLVIQGQMIFFEAHYLRLLSGMRQLKMEIPDELAFDYFKKNIEKYIFKTKFPKARLRITVFRNAEGFFLPNANKIGYILDIQPVNQSENENYSLGIYKDNTQSNSSLDTIKSTNRLINVMASIYAKEHYFDNVLLLNSNKRVVSVTNANFFTVKDTIISTPQISEGCIQGITRQKIISSLAPTLGFQVIETSIEPYQILDADEIFITNSIIGIQSITAYKNKRFPTRVGNLLKENFEKLVNSTSGFPES